MDADIKLTTTVAAVKPLSSFNLLKVFSIISSSLLILLIILTATISIFSSYILRTNTPKFLQFIAYYFFLPKDFFGPLLEDAIDISQTGAVKKYQYQHRYPGKHILDIHFDDLDHGNEYYQDRYKLNAEIKIDFFYSGTQTNSQMVNVRDFSASAGPKSGGVILYLYRVPEDLPYNETVTLRLEILKADPEFQKKFGPLTFCVRKISDD